MAPIQPKWGTEIGGNFFGGSGTPLSTYAWTINGIPIFVNGRGDLAEPIRSFKPIC